jgi:hypothetical protein
MSHHLVLWWKKLISNDDKVLGKSDGNNEGGAELLGVLEGNSEVVGLPEFTFGAIVG